LLRSGEIVRVLPAWYAETRPLAIYYSSRRLLPAKVRVFVDHVVGEARARAYDDIFRGK
jgi:DNA-binding transcriptional LysR family regulator